MAVGLVFCGWALCLAPLNFPQTFPRPVDNNFFDKWTSTAKAFRVNLISSKRWKPRQQTLVIHLSCKKELLLTSTITFESCKKKNFFNVNKHFKWLTCEFCKKELLLTSTITCESCKKELLLTSTITCESCKKRTFANVNNYLKNLANRQKSRALRTKNPTN